MEGFVIRLLYAKVFQDLTIVCECAESLRALKKFSMNNSAYYLILLLSFSKGKIKRSLLRIRDVRVFRVGAPLV